jgi:hypothetical protein
MINHSFSNIQERDFMKNIMALTVMVAFYSNFISSDVAAQCCGWGGGMQQGVAIAPETLAKFNKETKVLQEQIIDKQALLKKEWLKDDPDPDAIATIRKAIIDIQRDIQKIAKKLGIKNWQGPCCMHQENHDSWGCGGGGRSRGAACRGHEGGSGAND